MGSVQQAKQAAMRKILRPDEVQAKPDIGEPDGKYVQETNHVMADLHVSAISDILRGEPGGRSPIQRSENEEPEEELQRQPEEEEEKLQAKSESGHISNVNPCLESQTHSLKGGVQPLSENDRAFFEPLFDRDFSL